jgi:hypothetical protein
MWCNLLSDETTDSLREIVKQLTDDYRFQLRNMSDQYLAEAQALVQKQQDLYAETKDELEAIRSEILALKAKLTAVIGREF